MKFYTRPLPASRLLAAAIALVALALGAFASTAGAEVISVGGQKYGVELHATSNDQFIPAKGLGGEFTPLESGLGGPVMHSSNVYAIYWDPAKLRPGDPGRPGRYHGDWQATINTFLHDLASESGTNVGPLAVAPQYTDSAKGRAMYAMTFRGAYADHETYPADGCTDPDEALNKNFACLTDAQLRAELAAFMTANKLKGGTETIYYLFTPPGVTVCLQAERCSDSIVKDPYAEERTKEEQESYAKSFCSYHAETTVEGRETVYATIPWVAGTAGSNGLLKPASANGSDCQAGNGVPQEPGAGESLSGDGTYDGGLGAVLLSQVANQQLAMETDAFFNGWFDPVSGRELPDQCRNWFFGEPVTSGSFEPGEKTHAGSLSNTTINGHAYYLDSVFNQAALYYDYPGIQCTLGVNNVPSFTPATPVNAGDIVGFDGNESIVELEQSADATPASQPDYRATFAWNFGDGTEESGPGYSAENPSSPLFASVFHTYTYGGTYNVKLTVTDVGGNVASVSHQVTVVGPPPPAAATGSGAAASGAGSGSTTGAGTTPISGGSATAKAPVATVLVLSRSLKSALKHGLLVSYSVDQQIAGHAEVLLSRSMARRLHIAAPAASSLAAGSAPQVVIAKAFIRTTKGGRSKIVLVFSSKTAKRLTHQRSLSLMLRLFVRNSANKSATVLSGFSLRH